MIDGQQIVNISTIGSWYADGYLNVKLDNGETCRIHCNTIMQMVNEFEFDTVKKRTYNHLENPVRKGK